MLILTISYCTIENVTSICHWAWLQHRLYLVSSAIGQNTRSASQRHQKVFHVHQAPTHSILRRQRPSKLPFSVLVFIFFCFHSDNFILVRIISLIVHGPSFVNCLAVISSARSANCFPSLALIHSSPDPVRMNTHLFNIPFQELISSQAFIISFMIMTVAGMTSTDKNTISTFSE
jgi:hypothetical protein